DVLHFPLLALSLDVLQKDHLHDLFPPSSATVSRMACFRRSTASSRLVFFSCAAALVRWPPPPSLSMITCTLMSPRERALMCTVPSPLSLTTKEACTPRRLRSS